MKARARQFFLLGVIALFMFLLARLGQTDSLGVIQGVLGGFSVALLAVALWLSRRTLH